MHIISTDFKSITRRKKLYCKLSKNTQRCTIVILITVITIIVYMEVYEVKIILIAFKHKSVF